MVDPIGNKPSVVALRRIAPVSAPAAADTPAPLAATRESTAAALSSSLAAAPPVDAARVAQLRQAIQDGSFALDPVAIADRMFDWNRK